MNLTMGFTPASPVSGRQRRKGTKMAKTIRCESGNTVAHAAGKHFLKLTLFCLTLFPAMTSHAQTRGVSIHVLVHPPYSPYLDQMTKQAIITIANTSQSDITLVFQGKISNGSKYIQTKQNIYSVPVTIKAGTVKTLSNNSSDFNYASFLGPRVIDDNLTNTEMNAIYGSRILPEGTYTYCLSAFAVVGREYIPIQQAGSLCASFSVFFAQPPVIISPIDKAQINKQSSPIINFSWIPAAHTIPGSNISYDLYLVKVNDGDDPNADMQNAFTYHSHHYVKIPDIKTNNYVFNTKLNSFKIDSGQRYAVMVQAKDATGKSFFENEGKSEVATFNTGAGSNNGGSVIIPPGGFESTSLNTSGSSCSTDVFSGNTKDIGLSGSELFGQHPTITVGKFTLTLDKGVKRKSDGTYTGTGYVTWKPFIAPIELKVSFDDIKINTDGVVYSGQVITSMDGSFAEWAPLTSADNLADEASALTGLKLKNSDYTNLENHINDGAHLVNEILGNTPVDMPLGLNNKSLAGIPSTLAIMGITFTPVATSMNVLFNLNIPDAGEWLSLAGTCFQITPDGFSFTDGVLYLPEDHTVTLGGNELAFKKCDISSIGIDTTHGTYLKWNEDGLQKIVARADLIFSKTAVVPVDDDDKPVGGSETLHAIFDFTDWNDWVANCTLNHNFEIKRLPGFMITADNGIFYDHSVKRDATGFSLPEAYKNPAQGKTFEGLYIHDLTMMLPEDFKKFQGSAGSARATFDFHHFILDHSGVTTQINADNVIDLETGDLGGWEFSIDHFQVGIVQNNIGKDGMKMKGRIRLPISNTDALDYTCNLNAGESGGLNYQFVVTPKDQYAMDVWKAKLVLDHNTNLIIQNDKIGMAVNAQLDGNISIDINNIKDVPDISFTALSFQDMKLSNRDSTNLNNIKTGFYFDPGHWNLGSSSSPAKSAFNLPGILPEKPLLAGPYPPENIGQNTVAEDNPPKKQSNVAGFEVTLSNFQPVFHPNSLNEYELGVNFDVKLNIGFGDASVISGTTNLGILGKISVPGNAPPSAAFDKVDINKITVDGDVGPVSVKGELDFHDNDDTYGNGISGSLAATISPFAKLCASAYFGAVGGYHYWGVGGSVYMKNTVFYIGPFAINGFGGGVGYNMSLTLPAMNDVSNDKNASAANPTEGCAAVSVKLKPDKGSTTFSAGIYASMSRPEVINAALTLSATLKNGGLAKMQIAGDGAIISEDPPANKKAMLKVDPLTISYDLETNTFLANADVDFQFLVGNAHAHISIYGGPDGDYLYVGEPDNRATLTLISIGGKKVGKNYYPDQDGGGMLYVYLGANAYFDIGTPLPAFPPLPQTVSDFLYGKHGNLNGYNKKKSNDIVNSILGSNPGFMFGAEVQGNLRLTLLFLKAQVQAIIGFDMALEKLPPNGCGVSYSDPGIDGWYALGQLYAYLDMDLSIHVDIWFVEGDFSLAEFKAGAALQAGLINPSWAEGNVRIKGEVLGGLVTVDTDFPFSFGDKCTPPYNPLDNIKMITDEGPKDPAGVFDIPYVVYNLPMNGTDYSFSVPPDEHHSQPFTRTFRFYEQAFKLYKVKKDGTDSLISGTEKMNNDGTASAFYHPDMLEPHTKYKLYVKCYAEEVTGDGYNNSKAQDSAIYFTTGDAPDVIVPGNVVYTYPINGQRYVLKDEFSGQGHIKLAQWQSNVLPADQSKYDYQLKFIPEDGGDTITASFIPNSAQQSLDFHIPSSLKNSTIYRMEVRVEPKSLLKASYMPPVITKQYQIQTRQGNYTTAQINNAGKVTTQNKNISSSANIRRYTMTGKLQGGQQGSNPVFTLRFQTSRFNTFAEKMKSFGDLSAEKENYNNDIYLRSNKSGVEPFDEFDIKGVTSTYSNNLPGGFDNYYSSTYPPLFSVVIPFDDNQLNDKSIFDKMYVSSLKLVPEFEIDYGAHEVRKMMFPVYTVSTDNLHYDSKLSPAKKFNITGYAESNYSPQIVNTGYNSVQSNFNKNNGSTKQENSTSSGYQISYSNTTLYELPSSYYLGTSAGTKGSGNQVIYNQSESAMAASVNNSIGHINMFQGIRLVWKRDEYVYADYSLLNDFGRNFLLNKNMADMDNSLIKQNEQMKQQLKNKVNRENLNQTVQAIKEINSYESDTKKSLLKMEYEPLATGTYGSIYITPGYFNDVWSDQRVINTANQFNNMDFSQFEFPPTAGRTINFSYRYPFCDNCNIGSSVPEKFNYETMTISKSGGSVIKSLFKTKDNNTSGKKKAKKTDNAKAQYQQVYIRH